MFVLRFSNSPRNSTICFRMSFYLVTCFPESHGFVAVPVTISNNFVSHQQLDRNKLEHVSLLQLITGITTVSQETCYQILKHAKMDGQIFSENLRIVALKLLELTRFLTPNISIYFHFVRYWGSVVIGGNFLCIVHL